MNPTTEIARSREHVLLAHIADLELEVDRLRKQAQFLHQQVMTSAHSILQLQSKQAVGTAGEDPASVVVKQLMGVVDDLRESPGYHPVHDQVVAIAIRPIVEQVFKWQQRLYNAPYVSLRQELSVEHMEWFPARFRHILDNLLSNALRYRDPSSGESRVTVAVSASYQRYELIVADNGLGMPTEEALKMTEFFDRSAPARSAGIGVGLSVVKTLLEQCGGNLVRQSGDGIGTTFTATLPRYGINDYLNDEQAQT